MASNGLEKKAVKGKCRICQRVRFTDQGQPTDPKVKPVGEVRHGFATGYIWECIDQDDCNTAAQSRLAKADHRDKNRIEAALKEGNYSEYKIFG